MPAQWLENAAFYLELGIPFVMGTTGGDREKLKADVLKAGVYAVVAPQMGKQVRTYGYRPPWGHLWAVNCLMVAKNRIAKTLGKKNAAIVRQIRADQQSTLARCFQAHIAQRRWSVSRMAAIMVWVCSQ